MANALRSKMRQTIGSVTLRMQPLIAPWQVRILRGLDGLFLIVLSEKLTDRDFQFPMRVARASRKLMFLLF